MSGRGASILRGVRNKDQKALLRRALDAGATITQRPNGHLLVLLPDGTRITCGLTTCTRAVHHLRSDLRRAGVL